MPIFIDLDHLTLTLSPTICRLTFLKNKLFLGKSMGRGDYNDRMRKMLKALACNGRLFLVDEF